MTFKALADSFSDVETLPIRVNDVLDWIRNHTDHKDITLHGVERKAKAYRGGFRRRAISVGPPYSGEYEIATQILYGLDLEPEWKRLVIVKEALHVFDGGAECVDAPDKLRKLIPAIISRELQNAPFFPAINDQFGAFRAMAVLMPERTRVRLAEAVEAGTRTVDEVAQFAQLPDSYVDIWITYGDQIRGAF